jgi:hypothetical protein
MYILQSLFYFVIGIKVDRGTSPCAIALRRFAATNNEGAANHLKNFSPRIEKRGIFAP